MRDVVPGREPSAAEAHLLHERYRDARAGRLRSHYYAVKPLLPRRVQIAVRRAAARRQRNVAFPAWPVEPALLRLRAQALRAELSAQEATSLPVVNLWPGRSRFAFVLTHDVESRAGVERVPELLDVERRHGMVSSWNFCGDWYPVSDSDLDAVRRAGCEVGLHGITHDGAPFRSRAAFVATLPAIREQMEAWQAVGFRSPALWRNADWMHELPCLYDSSFPDTDPFEAQPGGCCSIHPFFFGDVVELPVTLDQDFTLFELLGERSIARWTEKSEWIVRHHGLVNVLVHPDYMDARRLALYDRLLGFLAGLEGGWHALPRDVAAWWRTRDGLRVVAAGDGVDPRVEGEGAERAAIAQARVEQDAIAYGL